MPDQSTIKKLFTAGSLVNPPPSPVVHPVSSQPVYPVSPPKENQIASLPVHPVSSGGALWPGSPAPWQHQGGRYSEKNTSLFLCRLLFLGALMLLSAYANAVKFNSVNNIYGISNRVTNSICQDGNGFIWASSKTGIMRLTQDDYRIYQLPEETAGVLMVWLTYDNSRLTAYTNNGKVFGYNPVNDRFDLLFNLNELLHNEKFDVYSLRVDANNDYWIALDTGLYRYHAGTLEKIETGFRERTSLLWHDPQNLLIAGCEGIRKIDIQTLKIRTVFRNNGNDRFSVSTLFFDRKRNLLWMGTLSNGLVHYDFNANRFSRVLKQVIPEQPILAIVENSDSTLLVGIDGQGIWELDKRGDQVLQVFKESADDPASLPGNGVYAIFYEPGKRVWVGTITGGVSFYDVSSPVVTQITHHSNNVNSLVNNDVNGILEDRDGKIWFATNNGICIWDPVHDQWSTLYNNNLKQAQVFLALCEDNQGKIWAGSYSSGVYVLDRKSGREIAHYAKDIPGSPAMSNFIFDIFEDSDHDLWIGGVNGEYVCTNIKENSFKTFSEEPVSSFAQFSPTKILVGHSYGLSMLDKQNSHIEKVLTGLVVQDILTIGNEIWICTSGEGLIEFNPETGTINKFTTKSGLPSNFINSFIYAGDYLWLGTESGLCRFDPREKTAQIFSSISPLSSVSFNKSAVTSLKNGKLAWGSSRGVLFFTPDSLYENSATGRIFFQDFTVSGRSIRDTSLFNLEVPVDELENIELKYFQNTISIELLPLEVSSGAKFSWKLDGFDQEWSAPSANRIITYTNIPSGNFTLRVKLHDSALSQLLSERSINIRMIPPFWKRSWFLPLIVTIVLGILVMTLLYTINTLKQKHTEEKVSFFTHTAHEIRTALTLIKAPVEELTLEKNLSDKGRKHLQIAVNQARQLSSVITQLMDFQKVDIGKEFVCPTMTDMVKLIAERILMFESFAAGKGVHIHFDSQNDRYVTAVDEPKIIKVIDNLISNAVKYSNDDNHVTVNFSGEKNRWTLTVKDNGIGISKKDQRKLFREFYRGENAINSKFVGSGIGLLMVKNYVSLHDGTVSLKSKENAGSTFQIVIPYKSLNEKDLPPIPDLPDHLYGEGSVDRDPGKGVENSNLKKMTVLIVEDNEELRSLMAEKIGGEFTPSVAGDGEIAWQMILAHAPDMIVSDVVMPNKNGFELCQLVKSTWETSHIPIILLSALTDKAQQLQGLGLGAEDYLTKPFDMSLLLQKIRTIIRNREVTREKALKMINIETSEPLLINDINDKFIKKLMEVAWANIANSGFDKDEYASEMNVSSSLLYKKTKSLTGQSPTDLMKTIRLRHALELLQSRKYTVTEISEMCGFGSVSYFCTSFRNFFGKSPTDLLN